MYNTKDGSLLILSIKLNTCNKSCMILEYFFKHNVRKTINTKQAISVIRKILGAAFY